MIKARLFVQVQFLNKDEKVLKETMIHVELDKPFSIGQISEAGTALQRGVYNALEKAVEELFLDSKKS